MSRSRRLRRWLAAPGASAAGSCEAGGPFVRQSRAYERTWMWVSCFYAASLYLAVRALSDWERWLAVSDLALLWPVAWLEPTGYGMPVVWGLVVHATAAAGAAVFPRARLARALAAGTLLMFAALASSFGKINHGWHVWLWTSIVLTFLPASRPGAAATRDERHATLLVVWTVQLLVLTFYTMSGLQKLLHAGLQMGAGEVHAFSPDGMAMQVAARLFRTGSPTLLGPFLVEHPLLGWPLYVGSIYVELAAVVVAFRPRLAPLWGLALIGMHCGIGLALDIWFREHIFALALIFVASRPPGLPLVSRDLWRELPGVPSALALGRRLGRARAQS